jgi:transposase-like protein
MNVLTDLKLVYGAINKEAAFDALQEIEKKWSSKYGYAIKFWKDRWEELIAYFDYPLEIRKIIYTTNAIESLNNSIRKYTKTTTVFQDDQSAQKAVYRAVNNVQQKWAMPIRSRGTILN